MSGKLLDIDDVQRDGLWEKEWRSLKGKDKESDTDDGLSMWLPAAF